MGVLEAFTPALGMSCHESRAPTKAAILWRGMSTEVDAGKYVDCRYKARPNGDAMCTLALVSIGPTRSLELCVVQLRVSGATGPNAAINGVCVCCGSIISACKQMQRECMD